MSLFKRKMVEWLGRENAAKLFGEKNIDEPIDPRIQNYPPAAKGLPAHKIEPILQQHKELIQDIKNVLSLDPVEFEYLIKPVIEKFAAYIHLLPASENHHHRKIGGLLRHSLEVAFFCAKASTGVIWPTSSDPGERRRELPRWRICMFLGGLLHDVGKSITDVDVVNESGEDKWRPFSGGILEWTEKNGVREYYISFKKNRHGKHVKAGYHTLPKIIHDNLQNWLTEDTAEIYEVFSDFLTGQNRVDPVFRKYAEIVKKADERSTADDLHANSLFYREDGAGNSADAHIVHAMRRLHNDKVWAVNVKGARIWVLHCGVFITWPQGARDIFELIQNDKIPGINKDPRGMARILIDCGHAEPFINEDGAEEHSWAFCPSIFQKTNGRYTNVLHGIKIASSSTLFNVSPPPIDGIAGKEALKILSKKHNKDTDTQTENNENNPVKKKKTTPKSRNQTKVLEALKETFGSDDNQTEEVNSQLGTEVPIDEVTDVPSEQSAPPEVSEIEQFSSVEDMFNVEAPEDSEFTSIDLNETKESLQYFDQIIAALHNGRLNYNQKMWVDATGCVRINYPEYLEGLFKEPLADVFNEFVTAGYLLGMPGSNEKFVQPAALNNPTHIIFCKEISERFPSEQELQDVKATPQGNSSEIIVNDEPCQNTTEQSQDELPLHMLEDVPPASEEDYGGGQNNNEISPELPFWEPSNKHLTEKLYFNPPENVDPNIVIEVNNYIKWLNLNLKNIEGIQIDDEWVSIPVKSFAEYAQKNHGKLKTQFHKSFSWVKLRNRLADGMFSITKEVINE